MKTQHVVANARNHREIWMILSLLLLISSVVFVAYARAEETGDAKAVRSGCPHLQSMEKQGYPDASKAGAPCCGHPEKTGMCPMALKEKMNLTDEQVEEIKKIKSAYRENTQELRDSIHEKWKEMEGLYRDPEARDRDIEKVHSKIMELKGEKKEKQLAYQLKLRGVFTPDQLRSLPPGAMKGFLKYGGKGPCSNKCEGKEPCPYKSQTKGMCPYKDQGTPKGTTPL